MLETRWIGYRHRKVLIIPFLNKTYIKSGYFHMEINPDTALAVRLSNHLLRL